MTAAPPPPRSAAPDPQPPPSDERLASLILPVAAYIEERFAVAVRFVEFQPPFLGDLNGAEIQLQRGHEPRAALFTLVHLFGHTVQWNLSERVRHLGGKAPGTYSAAELEEIEEYEKGASRYALALLHDLGIHDLDPWFADFAACDLAYLEHFYRTGERLDPASFWRPGRPLLSPLPIPRFSPTAFKYRWSGVVL
jgi:hypothetical protein